MSVFVGIVKDGRVRYYMAEDGRMEELGGWRVPDTLTAQQVAVLGLNIRGYVEAAGADPGAGVAMEARALVRPHPRNEGMATAEDVLALLHERAPMYPTAIAAALGLTLSMVKRRLNALAREGAVYHGYEGWAPVEPHAPPPPASKPKRRGRPRPGVMSGEQVLEVIRANPGRTQAELRALTGLDVKALSNRLTGLRRDREAVHAEDRRWYADLPSPAASSG